MEQTTSYAGQPVTISAQLTGVPGNFYVSRFSTTWSNQTYDLPFPIEGDGVGLPMSPDNDFEVGFYSTVNVTTSGVSVKIFPTDGFVGETDGDFDLNFNYAYSQPHSPLSSFTDNGITGAGSISDFLSDDSNDAIGPYDASAGVTFNLLSVSQTAIPEPGTWALMIAGFGAVGLAARRRRAAAPAAR